MEAGTGPDVRAADQGKLAGRAAAQCQREVDGLQDQPGGARGADVESVLAGRHGPGLEDEVAAAPRGAARLCPADGRRGADALQVLRLQARLRPARAEVAQVEA